MVKAFIDVTCESEPEFWFDRIAGRIKEFPGVVSVGVISGRSDIVVVYEAESFEKISEFVTAVLAPMEKVSSTVTHFMLKEYL